MEKVLKMNKDKVIDLTKLDPDEICHIKCRQRKELQQELSDAYHSISYFSKELAKLRAELRLKNGAFKLACEDNEKYREVLEMVMDNRKMPHPHKDYYERLCCLAERAREVLEDEC